MRFGSYKTSMTALIPLLLFGLTPLVFSQSMRPDEPKLDGTTRVGLVTPHVTLIGGGGSVPQETAALQKNVSSYLTGPRIGTIAIKAKLDDLALEEAKERECDFVVFISLTRKRRPAPKGTTSGYGSGTKAGDEYSFEYKVVPTGGGAAKENTLKRTLTADGEDALTPMIETMAQVVVELAKTSRPVHSTVTASAPGSANVPATSKSEPNRPPQYNKPTENPAPAPAGYGSLTASPRTSASRVNDPPKAPDTIRIGFVVPRVVGGGMNTANGDAAALRKTISSYLEGSNIETIELRARLDGLILTEAQKRDCDYVLYTTLTRKRKTTSTGGLGLGGILGGVGGKVGNKVPGTKTASQIGSEAAKVSGGIASLSKANDEMKFEYKLVTSDGTRTLTEKATTTKVKSDGDDVLSPMIESAAQAILDATRKN